MTFMGAIVAVTGEMARRAHEEEQKRIRDQAERAAKSAAVRAQVVAVIDQFGLDLVHGVVLEELERRRPAPVCTNPDCVCRD